MQETSKHGYKNEILRLGYISTFQRRRRSINSGSALEKYNDCNGNELRVFIDQCPVE